MRLPRLMLLNLAVVVASTVLVGTGMVHASIGAERVMLFTDTFDGAVNGDATYGLNDGLTGRQHGEQRGVTYTRASGVWHEASPPRPWYSQVNHPSRPGTLTFHLGHSAVRLDAPVLPGGDGLVTVRATVDPIVGDTESGQWASIVLTPDSGNSGYVTNPQVSLGVIVGSRGGVSVFDHGAAVGGMAVPVGGGQFTVTVSARPGGRSASVTVGGTSTTITLSRPFPSAASLFLGAYLDDATAVTAFDSLAVSAVDRSAIPAPGSGLRHFGYFGARLGPDTGNHLAEVAGRSTLNQVNISDFAGYAPEVLDSCGPAACAVYTGWEFFTDCDQVGSPNCRLYLDYRQRWQRLADAVSTRLDRVGAFYLLDEPYHRGARPADVATAARTIKATFPGATVMLVEAGYKVAAIEVPAEVDWIGFDDYCKPMAQVEDILRTLETRTLPQQRLFLFPPASPLPACGGVPGSPTDAELARVQRDYLALAQRHPRVIGLMTFGLWVADTPTAQLPATIDTHERIMAQLVAQPRLDEIRPVPASKLG